MIRNHIATGFALRAVKKIKAHICYLLHETDTNYASVLRKKVENTLFWGQQQHVGTSYVCVLKPVK
jgi:hypothetical protein